MVYDSDDKHLKISVRLFLDDLEVGLKPFMADDRYDIMDSSKWDETQNAIRQYFTNNLKLKTGNKEIAFTYLGSEVEVDAMWCFLEVEKLRPFEELTVEYRALTEVFNDQENLVHVRKDGTVKSCRLYQDHFSEVLKWD
ncbi:MAG: hypothetical protein ACJAZM_002957 [Cyclobacteriaceae bacterium]|jgi:hypothetical protein